MPDLHHLSALEQGEQLRRGGISPRELVEHYLARIERHNRAVGALTEVAAERALARADALEGL
ncbi:MAG: amidase, partial [Microbacteriaceae bacterium]|nr:amidase [Microbacteriaceae bacterium]